MDNKLTPFQAIIFVVLIFLILGAVLLFALQKSSNKTRAIPVTMWGTLSEDIINNLQNQINDEEKDSLQITYEQFTEEEFDQKLLEALASGTGPDIVIFDDDSIIKNENKLFLINYNFYPQIDFQNNFVEASEFLLRKDGILGLPFMIDPLVLYWNRTILNNKGIAEPPKYWDEFLTLIPKLVEGSSDGNIVKAGVALGEFKNISYAKEIFLTLVRQAGNPTIIRNEEEFFQSIFDQRLGYKTRPADAAINFFTQFSNPSKEVYSWNRSLPLSQDFFVSGDLAFYIGFASDRQKIVAKNSNLNFNVALLPQSRNSENQSKSVNAKVYFLAISNRTQSTIGAFETIKKLSETKNIATLSKITNLPPIRRDLLSLPETTTFGAVFNDSALISNVFLDPDKNNTEKIFQSMIESISSGRVNVTDAVTRTQTELNALFK